MKNEDELLEELAELCHDQWSNWMTYLFSKCYEDVSQFDKVNGNLVIPEHYVKRWEKQLNTSYENLSESEKNSDIKEAKKFLNLLKEKEII